MDIPDITTPIKEYKSHLDFELKSSQVGDSEMQHLDFAYANSLVRTFMEDPSLVLTIRGRKYTPEFSFVTNGITLTVNSVQTEVDAGYEGVNSIVLIEAKNSNTANTIIRQLYYPFRQWRENTGKTVYPMFFEKRNIDGENIYYGTLKNAELDYIEITYRIKSKEKLIKIFKNNILKSRLAIKF